MRLEPAGSSRGWPDAGRRERESSRGDARSQEAGGAGARPPGEKVDLFLMGKKWRRERE